MPRRSLLLLAVCLAYRAIAAPDPAHVTDAIRRAVTYAREHLESHGGYVWWYRTDLAEQAGEGGPAPRSTIWVQPPGTPAVGATYLRLHQVTGDERFLQAATAAGEALARGQLASGGWQAHIDFGETVGRPLYYRHDADRGVRQGKRVNNSSFDDDITQSALRLLIRLEQRLGGRNAAVHQALGRALEAVLKAQYPNGGFPQVFDGPVSARPVLRAGYPTTWPRTAPPDNDYWVYYTLNDGVLAHLVDTLLLAWHTLGDRRCLDAAARAGEFLLLAQMPEPQPVWAQQYDFDTHPCWARKFEPPAVTSLESAGALEALVKLWLEAGDERFLAPLPSALRWFHANRLPNGTWPRFHELRTNRPLYMTAGTYQLTYDGSNPPPHYGWKHDVSAQLAEVEAAVAKGRDAARAEQGRVPTAAEWRRRAEELAPRVAQALASLDGQGRWVTVQRQMRGVPLKRPREVLEMSVYGANLELLADYLEAARGSGPD
ncbi:MAG: pectic acid lyase [Armatimonadetes bacterium]|nr:pectic acid lyase [Armatimonadota bacterium]